MKKTDSLSELRALRRNQRNKAVTQLKRMSHEKVTLQRPVFFVPGWTDEKCENWVKPGPKNRKAMKAWISKIVSNPNFVSYIEFTKESKSCASFLDFGGVLKSKVLAKTGKNKDFDIVGHSMGGLDIVAAIIGVKPPLKNVINFISVATPHQGSQWGEIGAKFKKLKEHHKKQSMNLDPDQPPIKAVNTLAARKRLLQRIRKLYCLIGTRDMVVMKSSKYNKKGLNPQYYKKKVEISVFGGATHSKHRGITRDPRTILAIINILTGFELEKPKYNYGFVFRNK